MLTWAHQLLELKHLPSLQMVAMVESKGIVFLLLLEIKAYELHTSCFIDRVCWFSAEILRKKIIVSFFISSEKLKLLKIIALLFTDKGFLVYIHQLRGKKQKENSIISCFLREQVQVQCEMYLKYSEGPK